MYVSIIIVGAGGKDFESIQNRRLVFTGDHREHKVQIAIYDNSIRDTIKKLFSVQLSLISGVRTRLMPSAMNVTIEEDNAINGKQPPSLRQNVSSCFIVVITSKGRNRVSLHSLIHIIANYANVFHTLLFACTFHCAESTMCIYIT